MTELVVGVAVWVLALAVLMVVGLFSRALDEEQER